MYFVIIYIYYVWIVLLSVICVHRKYFVISMKPSDSVVMYVYEMMS